MNAKCIAGAIAVFAAAAAYAAPTQSTQNVLVVNPSTQPVPVNVTAPITVGNSSPIAVSVSNSSPVPVTMSSQAVTTDALWEPSDYVTAPAGDITWLGMSPGGSIDVGKYAHLELVVYCLQPSRIFISIANRYNGAIASLDQLPCDPTVNSLIVKHYDVALQYVWFGADQRDFSTPGKIIGALYARP